jgi:hypothetical protein
VVIALASLAGLAACTGSLDERSEVRDLRILALQADPPELVLGDELPDVALAALVADPREPARTIAYEWLACGLTDDLRCAHADYSARLGDGTAALGDLGATLHVTPDLLAAARELDTYRGFGGVSLVGELVLGGGTDEELHAIKQVTAWVGLPPRTSPNANPSPPPLLHDEVDWPPDEILEVAVGAEVSIEPSSPPEDAEHYSVYRFDLGIEELDEYLDFDFFASDGVWTRNGSGGPPDPLATETTLASVWTAPAEPPAGDVTIWVVVRDGRGGLAWAERRVHVTP